MRAEKIVLSIVGLIIGLLVAGGGFFVYKFMQNPDFPSNTHVISKLIPTPTPAASADLKIDTPVDEQVVNSRSVKISGKTLPNATVIASSETADQVGKASDSGDFSFTITVPTDTSIIKVTAILPDGTERTETQTITYSTESF
ncbi:MAG: hypothetical protein ACYDBV_14945 [Nitrospiria bacterium]